MTSTAATILSTCLEEQELQLLFASGCPGAARQVLSIRKQSGYCCHKYQTKIQVPDLLLLASCDAGLCDRSKTSVACLSPAALGGVGCVNPTGPSASNSGSARRGRLCQSNRPFSQQQQQL